jgi:hypothetical protein
MACIDGGPVDQLGQGRGILERIGCVREAFEDQPGVLRRCCPGCSSPQWVIAGPLAWLAAGHSMAVWPSSAPRSIAWLKLWGECHAVIELAVG